tara:strand:- start:233 stop:583 length:351 start_codon:yes stop_codon:yes gene_type:complete
VLVGLEQQLQKEIMVPLLLFHQLLLLAVAQAAVITTTGSQILYHTETLEEAAGAELVLTMGAAMVALLRQDRGLSVVKVVAPASNVAAAVGVHHKQVLRVAPPQLVVMAVQVLCPP